jgi:hypothetical protein
MKIAYFREFAVLTEYLNFTAAAKYPEIKLQYIVRSKRTERKPAGGALRVFN